MTNTLSKLDTAHIDVCRDAWHDHLVNCRQCYFVELYAPEHFCDAGKLAYDEYQAAILAHRDVEILDAQPK